jgi:hypothetical protein
MSCVRSESEGDIDAGEGSSVEAVDGVKADSSYRELGEWGMGGMLYIKLRIFIRSAYVSCFKGQSVQQGNSGEGNSAVGSSQSFLVF